MKLASEAITARVVLALAATAVSLCVPYDIIVAFTGLIFVCCQVCWALTLTAHGNLQLEQIEIGAKPQRRAVILKTDTGTTWEAIILDGESFSFNVQTWGETMRRLLEPIMSLSDANFMKIVDEAQYYVKSSAKGKGKSTRSSGSASENDKFQYLHGFR